MTDRERTTEARRMPRSSWPAYLLEPPQPGVLDDWARLPADARGAIYGALLQLALSDAATDPEIGLSATDWQWLAVGVYHDPEALQYVTNVEGDPTEVFEARLQGLSPTEATNIVRTVEPLGPLGPWAGQPLDRLMDASADSSDWEPIRNVVGAFAAGAALAAVAEQPLTVGGAALRAGTRGAVGGARLLWSTIKAAYRYKKGLMVGTALTSLAGTGLSAWLAARQDEAFEQNNPTELTTAINELVTSGRGNIRVIKDPERGLPIGVQVMEGDTVVSELHIGQNSDGSMVLVPSEDSQMTADEPIPLDLARSEVDQIGQFFNEQAVDLLTKTLEPEFNPLGVPKDYLTRRFQWDPVEKKMKVSFAPARYQTQDALRILANERGTLYGFQRQLVLAGYLDEKAATGLENDETIRALERLLGEANRTGEEWFETMERSIAMRQVLDAHEARTEKDNALANRVFVKPTYQAPDYAALSQLIKTTFRQNLGRDPQDWELALLGDKLSGDFRKAYEADVAARRLEWEAENRVIADDVEGPLVAESGTVQGVDPRARFQEKFEELVAPERRSLETSADYRQNLSNVLGSFSLMSRMVTRG